MMNITNDGILSWSEKLLAKALNMDKKNVKKCFTDGRIATFIIKFVKEILDKGELVDENYVLDSEGKKWWVKSITEHGINFCPSNMVGKGREFEEDGFLKKLDEIAGYIIADIESFPDIPFWKIKSSEVKMWWKNGKIGETAKISREEALDLISKIGRYKK